MDTMGADQQEERHEAARTQPEGQDVEDADAMIFSPPLYCQRYSFTFDFLSRMEPPVRRMADFGCAEGGFVRHLKQLPFLQQLALVDVDDSALDECVYRSAPIAWNFINPRTFALTIRVIKASVLARDPTFRGLDAVSCIELIEHLPASDLPLFRDSLFGYFKPRVAVLTTPNAEFNVLFPQLKDGGFRHWDHKFEWTRSQFQDWCRESAADYDYSVSFTGVGDPPPDFQDVGHCSQIAIFERKAREDPSLEDMQEGVQCTLVKEHAYPERKAGDPEPKVLEPFDWSFLREEPLHPQLA